MADRFQGILFDFDGTLADTMEDNYFAWVAVLAGYGIALEREQYFPLEGMELRLMAQKLFSHYGKPMSVDPLTIVQAKDANFVARHTFKLFPGVRDFLARCRENGIKTGVVTAARRDRLERSVPADFLALFSSIVSGDRLERGKPHPDPYLLGAKELGLPPEACVVVENAPLGIAAAKSAGCYCIGVTTTLTPKHLFAADVVVPEFRAIAAVPAVAEMMPAR